MRLGHLLRQGLLVCMCLFALDGQAIADPKLDGFDAYKAGAYAKAAKLCRPQAEQGDFFAQSCLGLVYDQQKNYKEAVKWYRLAVAQGDASKQDMFVSIQSRLGEMYENEQGVPQDYKEAAKWYRLAAEQGDVEGQNNLGGLYEKGLGVPQNYKEAVKWIRLAAEQGDAKALHNIGIMYSNGLGVPQNYVLAYMWFILGSANATKGDSRDMYIDQYRVMWHLTDDQITEAQELARKCTANKFKGC